MKTDKQTDNTQVFNIKDNTNHALLSQSLLIVDPSVINLELFIAATEADTAIEILPGLDDPIYEISQLLNSYHLVKEPAHKFNNNKYINML